MVLVASSTRAFILSIVPLGLSCSPPSELRLLAPDMHVSFLWSTFAQRKVLGFNQPQYEQHQWNDYQGSHPLQRSTIFLPESRSTSGASLRPSRPRSRSSWCPPTSSCSSCRRSLWLLFLRSS